MDQFEEKDQSSGFGGPVSCLVACQGRNPAYKQRLQKQKEKRMVSSSVSPGS